METKNVETTASHWKVLYKFSGAAALSMVGIIVVQLIVFMIAPPPLEGSAIDWFGLFQANKLIGLIGFELLMIIYVILSIPVTLSLYHSLRRTDQAFTGLYVVLSLIGVMSFIAARPAFEMLSLSDQFAAATTEAQRSTLLAAGEATVAAFHGTSFHVSYVLGSLTGLIISFIMLRSNIFSKATAYIYAYCIERVRLWLVCANNKRLPFDLFRPVFVHLEYHGRPQVVPIGTFRRIDPFQSSEVSPS